MSSPRPQFPQLDVKQAAQFLAFSHYTREDGGGSSQLQAAELDVADSTELAKQHRAASRIQGCLRSVKDRAVVVWKRKRVEIQRKISPKRNTRDPNLNTTGGTVVRRPSRTSAAVRLDQELPAGWTSHVASGTTVYVHTATQLQNKNHPERWRDKAFVLAAVSRHYRHLELASTPLRSDLDVVRVAVAYDGAALQYASVELRGDREVVLTAVKTCRRASMGTNTVLRFASDDLRNDREVVQTAVLYDPEALQDASASLRGDRAFMLAMVTQEGMALRFASQALRDDWGIVSAAVAQDANALRYASDRIQWWGLGWWPRLGVWEGCCANRQVPKPRGLADAPSEYPASSHR